MRSDVSKIKLAIISLWSLATPSAFGQSPPEPRLPGAVETAPAWLIEGSPFDMVKFFEMPPASENAAPLYLNALFEFGVDLAPCVAPERRREAEAIKQRAARIRPVYDAWSKDRDHFDSAALDAVLAENREGLRKLDLAQERPRCVFATGITRDSLVPHAQVARDAVRVLVMHAARASDRGDFDVAIDDVDKIFRLSRDLRLRGPMVCQLVSIAIDAVACRSAITPILADPRLKVEHCERLLRILGDHERLAADPYAEGAKAEYVMARSLLRTYLEGFKTTLDADNRPVEIKLDRAATIKEFGSFLKHMQVFDDPEDARKPTFVFNIMVVNAGRDRLAAADFASTLLASGPSYSGRARAFQELNQKHFGDRPFSLYRLISPNYDALAQACAREGVELGANRCLIALRRWSLTNPGPPADLAEVCRMGGLPGVPVDSYSSSGSPLKLVTVDGRPVVYSIGDDGRDDLGQVDANRGNKPGTPGDYLYPLPKVRPSPPGERAKAR